MPEIANSERALGGPGGARCGRPSTLDIQAVIIYIDVLPKELFIIISGAREIRPERTPAGAGAWTFLLFSGLNGARFFQLIYIIRNRQS